MRGTGNINTESSETAENSKRDHGHQGNSLTQKQFPVIMQKKGLQTQGTRMV